MKTVKIPGYFLLDKYQMWDIGKFIDPFKMYDMEITNSDFHRYTTKINNVDVSLWKGLVGSSIPDISAACKTQEEWDNNKNRLKETGYWEGAFHSDVFLFANEEQTKKLKWALEVFHELIANGYYQEEK